MRLHPQWSTESFDNPLGRKPNHILCPQFRTLVESICRLAFLFDRRWAEWLDQECVGHSECPKWYWRSYGCSLQGSVSQQNSWRKHLVTAWVSFGL